MALVSCQPYLCGAPDIILSGFILRLDTLKICTQLYLCTYFSHCQEQKSLRHTPQRMVNTTLWKLRCTKIVIVVIKVCGHSGNLHVCCVEVLRLDNSDRSPGTIHCAICTSPCPESGAVGREPCRPGEIIIIKYRNE